MAVYNGPNILKGVLGEGMKKIHTTYFIQTISFTISKFVKQMSTSLVYSASALKKTITYKFHCWNGYNNFDLYYFYENYTQTTFTNKSFFRNLEAMHKCHWFAYVSVLYVIVYFQSNWHKHAHALKKYFVFVFFKKNLQKYLMQCRQPWSLIKNYLH